MNSNESFKFQGFEYTKLMTQGMIKVIKKYIILRIQLNKATIYFQNIKSQK